MKMQGTGKSEVRGTLCWLGMLVLGLWSAFGGSLPARAQTGETPTVVQGVVFHSPTKLPFSEREISRPYRYQPATSRTRAAVRDSALKALKNRGYYLARVDSLREQKQASPPGVVYHLYLSPGPLFRFRQLEIQTTDSAVTDLLARVREQLEGYRGRPFTPALQKSLFETVLRLFEENGYPFCKITTTGFTVEPLKPGEKAFTLQVRLNPGELVRLSGMKFRSGSHPNPRYLQRTLNFRPGEIFRESRIKKYYQRLLKEDFVQQADPPELIMTPDSLFYLQMRFRDAPATVFDGILGYVPAPAGAGGEKGYFTGRVNVALRNVLGTGRRIEVFWQKPDRYSDEFRFRYREPFVLGLPFHVYFGLYRMVRDTTYIDWSYSLDLQLPLGESLDGNAKIYWRDVTPDSLSSRVNRLPQTRAVHAEVGLRWDTRDNVYNPRRGIFFRASFDYGVQRNVGPSFLIEEDSLQAKIELRKVETRFQFLLPLWKKQVLSVNSHSVFISNSTGPVRVPDMYWFGGATTIRGYREQQFFADQVWWSNLEYRFLLDPRSRLFVFLDTGYFTRQSPEKEEQFLLGYGLGIRFPVPLGIMQVDYGLAKGDPFREGKIHFRLINEF